MASDDLNKLPTHPVDGAPVLTSQAAKDPALNAHFEAIWGDIDKEAEAQPAVATEIPPAEQKTESPAEAPPQAKEATPAAPEAPRPAKARLSETGRKALNENMDRWVQDEATKLHKAGLSIPTIADKLDVSTARVTEILSPKAAEKPPAATVEEDPLDKIQPHPTSSEEHKSQFKQLREAAKGYRGERDAYQKELQAYKAKLPALIKEFGLELNDPAQAEQVLTEFEARVKQAKAAGSPETAQELDYLRKMQRQVGIGMDQRIYGPTLSKYNSLIDKLTSRYNQRFDPSAVKSSFSDPMKTNYKPWDQESRRRCCFAGALAG